MLDGNPRCGYAICIRMTALEAADAMGKGNNVVLSLVLTFFLGPFGMLYSTITGALVMLVLYLALGIPTLGWALAGLHPIAMIWGAWAASKN